jgi:hypothetical protein
VLWARVLSTMFEQNGNGSISFYIQINLWKTQHQLKFYMDAPIAKLVQKAIPLHRRKTGTPSEQIRRSVRLSIREEDFLMSARSGHYRITSAGWSYRTNARGWVVYCNPQTGAWHTRLEALSILDSQVIIDRLTSDVVEVGQRLH